MNVSNNRAHMLFFYTYAERPRVPCLNPSLHRLVLLANLVVGPYLLVVLPLDIPRARIKGLSLFRINIRMDRIHRP